MPPAWSDPKPTQIRRRNELEATRAARALTYLMAGWEGALLSNSTQIDADFRAKVRVAAAQVRRALAEKVPAHDVLLAHVAPLFEATHNARVRPAFGDDQ